MNSNKTYRTTGYCILSIAILITVFGPRIVRNYSISITTLFIIIAILAAVSALILWLTNSTQEAIRAKRNRTMHLIENGIKIEIPLNECEVKTNQYYEEVERNMSSQSNLIQHLANEAIDVPKRSIEQSVILYRTEINCESVSFHSEPLFYNGIDLEKFIQHNYKVAVYYNPNDMSDYFFDMQFYS